MKFNNLDNNKNRYYGKKTMYNKNLCKNNVKLIIRFKFSNNYSIMK